MPTVEAYFDGCMEPKNPGGHGAWGVVVNVDGKTVYSEGGYIGFGKHLSNNCSEYAGVAAAIRECLKHEGVCTIRGDSKLVVMQLQKKWKVKGGLYRPFYEEAMILWEQLKDRAKLQWIPREKNEVCDKLSKNILRKRGIKFRIQPE